MDIFKRLLSNIYYDSDGGGSMGAPPPPADTSGAKPEAPKNEAGEPVKNPTPKPPKASEPKEGEKGNDYQSAADIRRSIKENAKELDKSNEKQTIPLFEEELEAEDPDQETPEETQPSGDDEPAKPVEEEPETDPSENGQETPEGGEATTQPEGPYYDPEQHAKGKDVYPNAYKTRQDAEYAIAEKIKMFQDKGAKLDEVGSEIGSTIPYDVQETIEKYSDVTELAEASDDEIRDLIVNLDLSIKTVDDKYDVVSRKKQSTEKREEVNKKYEEALPAAQRANAELELQPELAKLGPNATFDDMLSIVDNQIQKKLQPINEEIKAHENDADFIKKNGQAAYVKKLRELENKKSEQQQALQGHKEAISNWNAARVEKDKIESEGPKAMSSQEQKRQQAIKMDKTFDSWTEDRKVGKFKLDIFEADTAQPLIHFKSFALSDKHRDKFDLTSKGGWDQMYKFWRTEMDKRWASKNKPPAPTGSKPASEREPIPEPKENPSGALSKQNTRKEMEDARRRIKESSKKLYG